MPRKITAALLGALAAIVIASGCARTASPPASPSPTKEQAIEAFRAMYPDLVVREATVTGNVWTITAELPPPDSSYPGPIRARTAVHPGGSDIASATVAGIAWYGDTDLAALSDVPTTKFPYPDTLGMAIAYIPAVEETHAVVTSVRRSSETTIDVTLANDAGRSWHLRFTLSRQDGWLLDEAASDVMRTAEQERERRFITGPDGRAMLTALRAYLEHRLHQPLRVHADEYSVETTQSWAQVTVTLARPDGKPVDYYSVKEFRAAIDAGAFTDGAEALMRETRGAWTVIECRIGATDTRWDTWGPFDRQGE